MPENFQERLLAEVATLLMPLDLAVQRRSVDDFFRAIGWHLEAVPGFPWTDVRDLLSDFSTTYAAVDASLNGRIESVEDTAIVVLRGAASLFDAVRRLQSLSGVPPTVLDAGFARLASDLVAYLSLPYLKALYPAAYAVLEILGLLTDEADAAATPPVILDGVVLRAETRLPFLNLARLEALVDDPVRALRTEYGVASPPDATAVGRRLFPRLQHLMDAIGMRAVYDAPGAALQLTIPIGGSAAAPMLSLVLETLATEHLALSVTPSGRFSHQVAGGDWTVDLALSAGAPFTLSVLGVSSPEAEISGSFKLARSDPPEPRAPLRIGSLSGTRLEVGGVQIEGTLAPSTAPGRSRYELMISAEHAALILAPSDGDGFTRQALPPTNNALRFDLGLGWSNQRGITFRGSGALELSAPTRLEVGPVTLRQLRARLGIDATGLRGELGLVVDVVLGPVRASIADMGLTATVHFREGNLGVLDVEAGFKAPTGLGIAVDAGPVHGGGLISFDAAAGRYAGVLQLSVFGVAVTAFGLLETRLPGGTPEYAFLILITAEFPPLQLGMGFTLNGLGGLAGIHRTVAAEPLRAAIRDGSAARLLFPRDPTRDGPQLITDLGRFFPAAADRFVFGPVAKIGYGTPPLVEVDLGLILEVPAPFRIVLLGVMRAGLPTRAAPVVRLNLSALGELDLGAKTFKLDASLFDSKVAGFDVAGDMALRLAWGDAPTFALAVGGFNPHFQPPPGFPALRRLTFALGAGDNPRLSLEAYLALTSNTLQLGAHAALHATAAGFSVDGALGFDALVVFEPFGFRVDVAASFALAGFGMTLASVRLEGTLEGPRPWHVTGHVHVSVLFVDVQVDVDARFGDEAQPAAPAEIDPWGLLQPALEEPKNWGALLAPTASRVASFATSASAAGTLVDPVGGVAVRQKSVPLGRRLTKVGERRVAGGPRTLAVTGLHVGGRDVPLADTRIVDEPFAPAQFEDLTDAQKLSRPSFEPMQAGLAVTARAVRAGAPVPAGAVAYETVVVPAPARAAGYVMPRAAATAAARSASAATASARRAGLARFAPPAAAPRRTALDAERYVVASTADLAVSALAAPGPHGAVAAALAAHLAAHPADRGRYHVVPAHEAEAA